MPFEGPARLHLSLSGRYFALFWPPAWRHFVYPGASWRPLGLSPFARLRLANKTTSDSMLPPGKFCGGNFESGDPVRIYGPPWPRLGLILAPVGPCSTKLPRTQRYRRKTLCAGTVSPGLFCGVLAHLGLILAPSGLILAPSWPLWPPSWCPSGLSLL